MVGIALSRIFSWFTLRESREQMLLDAREKKFGNSFLRPGDYERNHP